MALKVLKKEIETERAVGYRYLQVLARAETLVPGAGREAIDVLLWDANAAVIRSDVQNDRVVMDGTVNCQAVYRMGDETSLRALSAKAQISQVTDIPGAEGGMLSRVQAVVESVEARYENGHMVFQVGLGLHVRVMALENIEAVETLESDSEIRTRTQQLCLAKLAAEANETAVITGRVELPRSLDARTTLMDWGSVIIDSAEPDLGGVRVKGKAVVETLISSGIANMPAVAVKYPIEFDKLIELPEWLAQEAGVSASLRSIRTQVEQAAENSDGMLIIQADVYFDIAANLSQCSEILKDAYALNGSRLDLIREKMNICTEVIRTETPDTVRGTVMLPEGAENVGSIIAVRVLPNVAETITQNGKSRISGLFDVNVLYMTAGSDHPASAQASLEFGIDISQALNDDSMIAVRISSAEAGALMSDRLDLKIGVSVLAETRKQGQTEIIRDVQEGDTVEKRSGYVICWPEADDEPWTVAKRYQVAPESIEDEISAGKPVVLRV